ncbi:MAG: hypothetical protein U9N19_02465 [Thermodesulfobacteriota bacterium]|nr:hypothetical protein [Thermodesulfobacteriota bacterium]
MKQLHIFKSRPENYTEFLAEKLAEDHKMTRFNLYENTDYDKLVKLIFDNDEVISWW